MVVRWQGTFDVPDTAHGIYVSYLCRSNSSELSRCITQIRGGLTIKAGHAYKWDHCLEPASLPP